MNSEVWNDCPFCKGPLKMDGRLALSCKNKGCSRYVIICSYIGHNVVISSECIMTNTYAIYRYEDTTMITLMFNRALLILDFVLDFNQIDTDEKIRKLLLFA